MTRVAQLIAALLLALAAAAAAQGDDAPPPRPASPTPSSPPELPPHLRLPPLAAHRRDGFVAAVRTLVRLGERAPQMYASAGGEPAPADAAARAPPGRHAAWSDALPAWLSRAAPLVASLEQWAGATLLRGGRDGAAGGGGDDDDAAAAVAQLAAAAQAGFVPALQYLACLRLFGRREVVPLALLAPLVVPLNTSAAGLRGKGAEGACGYLARLHAPAEAATGPGDAHAAAAAAAAQQQQQQQQQLRAITPPAGDDSGGAVLLTLRLASVGDALVALSAAACVAHNELDVLAHQAHMLDSTPDAALALAAAEAARSPLTGALRAKLARAAAEAAAEAAQRTTAERLSRWKSQFGGRPPPQQQRAAAHSAGGAGMPAPPPAGGPPGAPAGGPASLPVAASEPLMDRLEPQFLDGGLPPAAAGDYDPYDAEARGGGYPYDGQAGGFSGGDDAQQQRFYDHTRDDPRAYMDEEGYEELDAPAPTSPPKGPWVTGASMGAYVWTAAEYEPGPLGIFFRRDILDSRYEGVAVGGGGGGSSNSNSSSDGPLLTVWDDIIASYETALTSLALLHLARVRMPVDAVLRALGHSTPAHSSGEGGGSSPLDAPRVLVRDATGGWAGALADATAGVAASGRSLLFGRTGSAQHLVTPAWGDASGAMRLFPTDLAALDVLDALAHRQVGAAQLAMGTRWLRGQPTGSGAPHALLPDSAASCQRALSYVLPLTQDAANDASVVSASHPESSFPRLRELWEDAGLAGVSREDALNLDWLRNTAESGVPGRQTADAQLQMGELLMFGYPAAGLRPDPLEAARLFRRAADGGNVEGLAQLGMMLLDGGLAPDVAAEFIRSAASGPNSTSAATPGSSSARRAHAAAGGAAADAPMAGPGAAAAGAGAGGAAGAGALGGAGGGGRWGDRGQPPPPPAAAGGDGGGQAAPAANHARGAQPMHGGGVGGDGEGRGGPSDLGAAPLGGGDVDAAGPARPPRSVDDDDPQHMVAVVARRYLEEAVAGGSSSALAGLGYVYQIGAGVPRNLSMARDFLQRAVDAGMQGAHSNLAALYMAADPADPTGAATDGVVFNATAARAHLEAALAGGTGFAPAQYNLGLIEYYGWDKGGVQDCRAALRHWLPVATRSRWADEAPFSIESALDQARADGPSAPATRESALLQYLSLSQLGLESALDNAAFLLETLDEPLPFARSNSSSSSAAPSMQHLLDGYRVAAGFSRVRVAAAAGSDAAAAVPGAQPAAPPASASQLQLHVELDQPGAGEPVLLGWLWRVSPYVASISRLTAPPPQPQPAATSGDLVVPAPAATTAEVVMAVSTDGSAATVEDAGAAGSSAPGSPAVTPAPPARPTAALRPLHVARTLAYQLHVQGASQGSHAALVRLGDCFAHRWQGVGACEEPDALAVLSSLGLLELSLEELHANVSAVVRSLVSPPRSGLAREVGDLTQQQQQQEVGAQGAALEQQEQWQQQQEKQPQLPQPQLLALFLYGRAAAGDSPHAAVALARGYGSGQLGVLPLERNVSLAWALLAHAEARDYRAEWPAFLSRLGLVLAWAMTDGVHGGGQLQQQQPSAPSAFWAQLRDIMARFPRGNATRRPARRSSSAAASLDEYDDGSMPAAHSPPVPLAAADGGWPEPPARQLGPFTLSLGQAQAASVLLRAGAAVAAAALVTMLAAALLVAALRVAR